MEYRRLTASDLASLLELYKQLDEDDDECPMDQSEEAWKEIEANANIGLKKRDQMNFPRL